MAFLLLERSVGWTLFPGTVLVAQLTGNRRFLGTEGTARKPKCLRSGYKPRHDFAEAFRGFARTTRAVRHPRCPTTFLAQSPKRSPIYLGCHRHASRRRFCGHDRFQTVWLGHGDRLLSRTLSSLIGSLPTDDLPHPSLRQPTLGGQVAGPAFAPGRSDVGGSMVVL